MKVFAISMIMVILCITGMAISFILKKDGRFPDGEISHSKELRDLGIECAKSEELRRWTGMGRRNVSGRVHRDCPSCGCKGCAFSRKQGI